MLPQAANTVRKSSLRGLRSPQRARAAACCSFSPAPRPGRSARPVTVPWITRARIRETGARRESSYTGERLAQQSGATGRGLGIGPVAVGLAPVDHRSRIELAGVDRQEDRW